MGAATIVNTFDLLVEWVDGAIVPRLEYLKPSDDGVIDGYEVEWVHPRVFPNFVPTEDRIEDGGHRFPFIAVQLLSGNDLAKSSGLERNINVRLVLGVWNPGHFNDGVLTPSMDGWRDVFNGVDVIAGIVESADTIADSRLDEERGISYGLLDEDGAVLDQYPYFLGRVDFTLQAGKPANKRFENLL